MLLVAFFIFDIPGLILDFIPGFGVFIVFLSDMVFIPWYYFSGMKFTGRRIGIMGVSTILESLPIIGNLPLITFGVVASYYSNK